MADLTAAGTSLTLGPGALTRTGIAGASGAVGDPVFQDSTDSNSLKPSDNNVDAATADCVGIAMHAFDDGDPVTYCYQGLLNYGDTITVGTVYCVSANVGQVCPEADVGTTKYKKVVAIGSTAVYLYVNVSLPAVLMP